MWLTLVRGINDANVNSEDASGGHELGEEEQGTADPSFVTGASNLSYMEARRQWRSSTELLLRED